MTPPNKRVEALIVVVDAVVVAVVDAVVAAVVVDVVAVICEVGCFCCC